MPKKRKQLSPRSDDDAPASKVAKVREEQVIAEIIDWGLSELVDEFEEEADTNAPIFKPNSPVGKSAEKPSQTFLPSDSDSDSDYFNNPDAYISDASSEDSEDIENDFKTKSAFHAELRKVSMQKSNTHNEDAVRLRIICRKYAQRKGMKQAVTRWVDLNYYSKNELVSYQVLDYKDHFRSTFERELLDHSRSSITSAQSKIYDDIKEKFPKLLEGEPVKTRLGLIYYPEMDSPYSFCEALDSLKLGYYFGSALTSAQRNYAIDRLVTLTDFEHVAVDNILRDKLHVPEGELHRVSPCIKQAIEKRILDFKPQMVVDVDLPFVFGFCHQCDEPISCTLKQVLYQPGVVDEHTTPTTYCSKCNAGNFVTGMCVYLETAFVPYDYHFHCTKCPGNYGKCTFHHHHSKHCDRCNFHYMDEMGCSCNFSLDAYWDPFEFNKA